MQDNPEYYIKLRDKGIISVFERNGVMMAHEYFFELTQKSKG